MTNKLIRFVTFFLIWLVLFPVFAEARASLRGEPYELSFLAPLPDKEITLPAPKKEAKTQESGYDLDKLAKAVAMHETLDCDAKAGSALVNNCFGIMAWDSQGRRYYKPFKTKEESYADFKRIWSTYYKDFPNYALAKKYSGDDRTSAWLANVTRYYSEL